MQESENDVFGEKALLILKEMQQRQDAFITSFELAKAQMLEWQQQLEQHALAQNHHVSRQLNDVQNCTEALSDIITETGIARVRLAAEKALTAGEKHLLQLAEKSKEQQLQFKAQQSQFSRLANQQLEQLKNTEHQMTARIQSLLSQIDLDEFYHMLDDSRESVELAANESISQSNKLLRHFQLKAVVFAMTVAMFSSLAIGLYLSDELPWEIHRHAMEERHAGRALLAAWPNLDANIQHKILHHRG